MLQRFASGSLVASVAIAIAASVVLATQGFEAQRFYLLLAVWCIAPCVWGLWAMLAPVGWVPQRLPLWGAILGLIAGTLAAFVINLPSRVLGLQLPLIGRIAAVVVMVVFYFCLWMVVRAAFRKLTPLGAMAARR